MQKKIAKSLEDTHNIAKDFLTTYVSKGAFNTTRKGAMVVGLYGDLGAGKTHFVKAIAKELSIKSKINSPTFVIMKRYPIGKTSVVRGFLNLVHIDAYRLKNEKELLHLGWAEMIKDSSNIIFIEWPENVIKAIPKNHHKIAIAHTKEGNRIFKIS